MRASSTVLGDLRRVVLCVSMLATVIAPAAAQQATAPPPTGTAAEPGLDSLGRTGFDHFYNLDYERAIHDFQLDYKSHPGDLFAANHLLTALLFHELYGMGVLDTAYYSDNTFTS